MGRPENENAIFKKNIFFDMLLRRIKPNEIQKKKLHNLLFIWTLIFHFRIAPSANFATFYVKITQPFQARPAKIKKSNLFYIFAVTQRFPDLWIPFFPRVFWGKRGLFGAYLPPRLRLGGKYGPSRPLLPPQTLEKRSFTAGKRFLTEKCRTKYQYHERIYILIRYLFSSMNMEK